MTGLSLTTPALLFSSISLILLAYTTRFLAYASLIRTLHNEYKKNGDVTLKEQIFNLRKRLYLTRSMQLFGIYSLLLCVLSMFFFLVQLNFIGVWLFAISLISLIISLGILIWEIQISVKALEHHLKVIENE